MNIVDEFDKSHVPGQLFLKNAVMWSLPGAERRPKVFQYVSLVSGAAAKEVVNGDYNRTVSITRVQANRLA
jgi:hypothetical protein